MANNTTLIIRNEIGGLETIDTAWDAITRNFYDQMSAAGQRLTFQQTDALDNLVKALKLFAGSGSETYPVDSTTGNAATVQIAPGKSVMMTLMYVDVSGTVGKIEVFAKSDGVALSVINMGMLLLDDLADIQLSSVGNDLIVTPVLVSGNQPEGSFTIISSKAV